MVVLLPIAFVAGMVTAISPCVLPVLPIVFAGGATGGARRPYAVVAGLVVSFTVFTLAATALLSALGLPDDLLRNIAIGVVLAMGVGLLVPRLGDLLERPFRALGRRRPGDVGGGFLLGVSLGLLFTPCAGPIIAAVATVAATERFTRLRRARDARLRARRGRRAARSSRSLVRRGLTLAPLRARAPMVRRALGAIVVAAAVVMALGLDTRLADQGARLHAGAPGPRGERERGEPDQGARRRERAGRRWRQTAWRTSARRPSSSGSALWLNSDPLTIADLRGKVVLVDFWTYSCVNCLRTLPYLERWDATYRDDGLVIVGVHTPEFAFERDPANVRRAVAELGIDYPVALDPQFGTWNAWGNQYWPAEYFVDRRGHVRYAHFGEGEYEEKERVIRELLAEPGLPSPVSPQIADQTPTEPQTPETYLGLRAARQDRRLAGDHRPRARATSSPPISPKTRTRSAGSWTIEGERAVAGREARLRLHYLGGHKVFLVLGAPGGGGSVRGARSTASRTRTIRVDGHRLYELAESRRRTLPYHLLDLALHARASRPTRSRSASRRSEECRRRAGERTRRRRVRQVAERRLRPARVPRRRPDLLLNSEPAGFRIVSASAGPELDE